MNKWLSEEDLARITGVPTARETRKDVYVDPREIPAIKVQQALITADGHVPTAAKLLDCSTPALYNKINKGKVKQYCNLDAEGRIIGSTDRNVYVPRSVPATPAPAASPASQPTSSNGHTVQGAV